MCITDFGKPPHVWKSLQESVDWSDPPAELVVQSDLGVVWKLQSLGSLWGLNVQSRETTIDKNGVEELRTVVSYTSQEPSQDTGDNL